MIKTPIPVYLYAIECKALSAVKIGTSTNVQERLTGLQCANPAELTLLWSIVGSVRLEFAVHNHLAEWCLRGEWFDATKPDVQAFLLNPLEFQIPERVKPTRRPKPKPNCYALLSLPNGRQVPIHKLGLASSVTLQTDIPVTNTYAIPYAV